MPNSCHPVLATNRGPAAKNQVTLNVNSIKPPGGEGGAYLFQSHLRLREWWGGGVLFNLAKMIVISSPERTRIQSGKAQVREVGGHTDLL